MQAAQPADDGRAPASLDELAGRLASAIGQRRTARPAFIEFAGTPRAGKTTVLKRLSGMLHRYGLRVILVHESAAVCPIPDKQRLDFNVWTLCRTLGQLLQARHQDTDMVLIDRGLVDVMCWMDWYVSTGRVPAADHEAIEAFTRLPRWFAALDLVLIMTADPRVAVERHGVKEGGREPGRIVNVRTLSEFNASVDRICGRFAALATMVQIDTTRLLQDEVLRHVMDASIAHF